jgi:glycosyltransferase involved in cell wall biosynthesis
MKVLLLSIFHPELVRGGAQQICYELFEGLKAIPDVEPTLMATVDPSFSALYKSGARITGFDGREGEFIFLSREYDYWWHKTSNPDLLEFYSDFLETVQPDVVHFHHFLLFGVDLISLTRRVLPQARIVFTFHEFLAMCNANGQMVRKTDGSLCDRPSPVRCHQCFPDRGPEEFFLRELWFKRHLDAVDMFTTPSRFMIEHYVRWGIDRNRIAHVTNGQPDYSIGKIAIETRRSKRNRFGFFGQLVDNKGVWVLLKAAQILRDEGFTDFSIEINGDNLQYASEERRQEIERFRKDEEALPPGEQLVTFNGSYHTDQLSNLMARVDWCVVPSVWWEIFGLVISEAWMFKKPVIASNVGGPAERISHEVNGLLFQVGDAVSLAETIRRACTEKALWDRLVAGITSPPTRDTMVDGYMEVYRDEPLALAEAS